MKREPLASRIRPKNLEEFVGQEHLLGKGMPLRAAVEKGHRFSFLLWGPPGCGKTTFARIYSRSLNAEFFELSAVSAGKGDIKKIFDTDTDKDKVLFLDEIHRFNKAQQDHLLPYVESGDVTLIGATTENPGFEVIAPLLSRCRVFSFEALNENEMEKVIKRTNIKVDKAACDLLVSLSNGDARRLISMVEGAYELYGKVSVRGIKDLVRDRGLRYDKVGDRHYDSISAYIKSMRAGQVNAALYYLARMLEGGEDPKFIARRMVIFASEDIGQALPTALVVANEVFSAVDRVGLPEAEINLAQGTVYLSVAKKDRSSYEAYRAAQADVGKFGDLPIPLFIRNPSIGLTERMGYGRDYKMYSDKSMLPEKLEGRIYYSPPSDRKDVKRGRKERDIRDSG